jgi:peptidyl-prolyl cis-trans isomerase B (cyclophilin B)
MRAMLRTRHLAALAAAVMFAVATSGCAAPTAPAAPASGQTGAATSGEPPLHTSTVKVAGTEVAVLKTAKGDIQIAFYAKEAPNTVASFIELTRKGFYDGTKFHRVEPGLLIQGGDPLSKTDDPATGTGGPGWRLKAEFNAEKHIEGTVAMARREDGNDTAGSQFYIMFAPNRMLDGKYTVFGRVISGMDVLANIQRRDPDTKDPPRPDKIIEAKIVRLRGRPSDYVPKKMPD